MFKKTDILQVPRKYRMFPMSHLRLYRSVTIHLLTDPENNCLFELRTQTGTPLMAFLYRKFSKQSVGRKREIFAKQFCSLEDFPTTDEEVERLIPMETVTKLPIREMWTPHTDMGEDAFWCEDGLRLEILAFQQGCNIELVSRNHGNFAYFRDNVHRSDADHIVDFALAARKLLHSDAQVRIESLCPDRSRICSYVPVKLFGTA